MNGSVGIIFHPAEPQGGECLADACSILDSKRIRHWEMAHETQDVRSKLLSTGLLLTLGGDGTFMHGARLAAPFGIPVLGVNLGRLGFLTELEPRDLRTGLDRFVGGDYRVEQRVVAVADVNRNGRRLTRFLAVNEAVVGKGAQGKLVRLRISANGEDVGTIDADGVLVATATGSTAYSLALGGPILAPELRGLLMVPMNPFALTVRPILFPPGQPLRIVLQLGDGMLTADGFQNRRLRQGDEVAVHQYRRLLSIVRFGERDRFFQRLRDKIGWGTPLVPLR